MGTGRLRVRASRAGTDPPRHGSLHGGPPRHGSLHGGPPRHGPPHCEPPPCYSQSEP